MAIPSHPRLQLRKKALSALAIAALFLGLPTAVAAAERYPDLLTIPPSDLQFASEPIDGQQKIVLRFTNTVWNAGSGPLEMYGSTTPEGQTQVTQRIHDDKGSYSESTAGNFVWHPAHSHWHFEKFAMYELWDRSIYESWIASGRQGSPSAMRGFKTTFCIRETELIYPLPGTPQSPIHTECNADVQGLSVGWGDSYRYDLPEQWVEIGDSPLPNGNYILRSVADPDNFIKESPDNDPYYESGDDNEATTTFEVVDGTIYPD